MLKEDENMHHGHDHDEGGDTAGWSAFLAGALIGAGVALLFAPQQGSELRSRLRDYANRAKDDLMDKGQEAWDTAVERGKEYYDKGEEVVREARELGKHGQEAVKDTGRAAREFAKHAPDAVREAKG
jgi:gas vesicle protein